VVFQEKEDEEMLIVQLRFIIECISNAGQKAIVEQAVDALSNIFIQSELKSKLDAYIDEVVRKISFYIEITQNPTFFNVIEELFTSYKRCLHDNPVLIGLLISSLVKKTANRK
jgi:hypothetical protein